MDAQHDLVSKVIDLTANLGRAPRQDEFDSLYGSEKYKKSFGSYSVLLQACGLGPEQEEPKKQKKFKFQKRKIESFVVHEAPLEELFARAGNPEVLRVVEQPDTHVENRDHQAVDVFLQFLEWYQPDVHIIMGDFLDAAGISHWPPNTLKPRNFIGEILEGRELLSAIRDRTKKCSSRFYITGNHEDWINQAMVHKLPEFFNGLEQLGLMPDLKSLLDLDNFGYDLIPLNELLKIGKAYLTHGLYIGSTHPKKHLDTIKANIYYGHEHDILGTHQPSISGFIEAQSLGCLCKKDAPFMKGKPTNWAHGFGIKEFFRDGSYSFYLPRIFDGRLSFNGKVFEARK